MKKALSCIILLALLTTLLCSCIDLEDTQNQGSTGKPDNEIESATPNNSSDNDLGKYEVVIESCRLANDYTGAPIVIVKYKFTNNDDDPACFSWTFDDAVFQGGVGLNECYLADDTAEYSTDNQTKEIKKGASLTVEVAYKLNDTETDIDVEVSELISLNNKTVTKKFSIK